MQVQPSPGQNLAGRILSGAMVVLGLAAALGAASFLADALLAGQQTAVIGGVGLAVLLLVLALDARVGLWLWIALGPFAGVLIISLGLGIPNLGAHRLASLFLMALLIAQVASGQRRLLRLTAIDWAALFYAIGVLASAPASWSGLNRAAQGIFDFVILPLLGYVCARNLQAGKRDRVGGLLAALAFVGVILGLATIREQLLGHTFLAPHDYVWTYAAGARKITSVFGQPAMMAMTLSVIAPALFYSLIRARNLGARLLWGGALLITLLGDFLTYVRGGWLAALVGLGTMLVLSRRARRYLLPGVIVIAIALLLFGGTFINQGAVESRLNSQAPITYRLDAWKIGWELFKKSPLVGLGFDNYIQEAIAAGWAPRIGPGQQPWVASHNIYLYIGTSAGLVGLVPFVVLLAAIGWRAIALWRSAGRSPAIHKDLLAWLLGTLFGYVLIIGTFDGLSAQLANILMFVIAGTVLGAHEPAAVEAK